MSFGALQAADYYVAPPWPDIFHGTPTNNDPGNPIAYDSVVLRQIIFANPIDPAGPDVTLHFLASYAQDAYTVDALVIDPSTPVVRTLKLTTYPQGEPVTLKLKPPQTNQGALPTELFDGPAWSSWLLHIDRRDGIAYFEAEHLILDVNWDGWVAPGREGGGGPKANGVSPAYVDGLRLGALRVRSKRGHIHHVTAKHCGANGLTPKPYWIAQGAECFPLLVYPSDHRLAGAWLIEDCEVSDFHSFHEGYATAIMVNPIYDLTFAPANPDHRVATVRRCLILGNGSDIAFGSANAAGVSFYDNVAVNVAVGLNQDSGKQANIDFNHNFVLDTCLLANVGGAGWDQYGFVNYSIDFNAVRMLRVPLRQLYSDYLWKLNVIGSFSNWMPVTDPALDIGRFATNYCVGLLTGGSHDIRFQDNRFTTRPIAGFFEPNPGDLPSARWRPLWRPDPDPETGRPVTQTGTVTATGNLVSSLAFDFTQLGLIADLTELRPAIDLNPLGFTPGGLPGRVLLTNFASGGYAGRLAGVYEVSITDPQLVDAVYVEVKARLLFHPSALNGSWESVPDTRPASLERLLLLVRSGPNTGLEVNPTVSGGMATFRYLTAQYAQPGQPDPGRDEIVVFYDLNTNDGGFQSDLDPWAGTELLLGQTVRFERTPDVTEDRRLKHGTIRLSRSGSRANPLQVRVFACNEPQLLRVAEPGTHYELQTTGGQPLAYDPLSRAWTVPFPANEAEVTVRVQPKTGPQFQDVANYRAAYLGLLPDPSGLNYAVAPPGRGVTVFRTTYSTGAAVTLWDGPRYRLHSLADRFEFDCDSLLLANAPATEDASEAAALAALASEANMPDAAGVVEQWTALQPRLTRVHSEEVFGEETILPAAPPELGISLSDAPRPEDGGQAGLLSTTYLDATATFCYAINQLEQPSMGGHAVYEQTEYDCLPDPEFHLGGRWDAPDYGNFGQYADAPSEAEPKVYGVDNAGNLVGRYGSQARYVDAATGISTPLPARTPGMAGEALWLPPRGGQPVGWSALYPGAHIRPTRWVKSESGSWQAEDLESFWPGNYTKWGYAYMNNDQGVTVGKTRVEVGTANAWRAYRTVGSGRIQSYALNALELPPLPSGQSTPLTNNAAYGVNGRGDAAGASDCWWWRNGQWKNETRAVVWWAGREQPVVLGTLQPDTTTAATPARSEAYAMSGNTAANPSGVTVLGSAWATPVGYARAFVMDVPDRRMNDPGDFRLWSAYMLNLNDPHLTHDPTGWTLLTAEAINDRGWIVGNGLVAGRYSAFVLVPQPPESQ